MVSEKNTTPGKKIKTSAEIRQSFLDYFAERGHTIVPSASLVPGDDPSLLFTNAGMVQFKDVFLDIGSRKYTRAVDSQKCMRVAGKHNDLEDVGRDDIHHTFFEMLGNWSFGDYYKKETISWAWDLLNRVWGLSRERLYATVFEDELGEIPRDDEAAAIWLEQEGFLKDHLLFFGRKENFWEMADTGPCGPDTEIHYDRGPEFCDKQDEPGHVCGVNGDCQRYLELWNLVFIQYNRTSPTTLESLPKKHVDTGMGFDRVVSVIQDKDSNYKTDLFEPIMARIQELADHTFEQRMQNYTPYRVIADHVRASSFLIADGVVPGNLSRNYVCRMIVRRASRFGAKIGFDEPFLAKVATVVIEEYGDAYPELKRNRKTILDTLTDEEERFHHTVDTGVSRLMSLFTEVEKQNLPALPGKEAFDLYATYGLPFEITRDIADEHGYAVDEAGFKEAMEEHRLASGAGQTFGGVQDIPVEAYQKVYDALKAEGALSAEGVTYDPYASLAAEGKVLALMKHGVPVEQADEGETVEVILPVTGFYVESGGQAADKGSLLALQEPKWEIEIDEIRRPAEGLIVHVGKVTSGTPHQGDPAVALVDTTRRHDIMRNHTATHLLHASLHEVLGDHARQAGSLVAPDRLRFDFTHSKAMTVEEVRTVEKLVNNAILENYPLHIRSMEREEAISQGAMALFGEKYDDVVRTVTIGKEDRFSFELCGGTHVEETGEIGLFEIVSEGSAAAGIRRIEAITGREALRKVFDRRQILRNMAQALGGRTEDLEERVNQLLEDKKQLLAQVEMLQQEQAQQAFEHQEPVFVEDIPVLTALIENADVDTLRGLTDKFREKYPSGIAVLGTIQNEKPILVAAVSKDLVQRGFHAGNLVRAIAPIMGGGGGGKPGLAQAGGSDPSQLGEALAAVPVWIREQSNQVS
ncbi:MAG: alanine--tRNA ligase [Anaerolineales bacterium]|nr:alanine--tRNA ligase [Anaerolineales bacterium]